MWSRRIAYLAFLLGCLVFYGYYRGWFSWFLLILVLILPWFSLILSLPGMFTAKASLRCPEAVRQDMPVRTSLQVTSILPAPPVRCTMRLVNSLTDERFIGEPGERLPTGHCGVLTISFPSMYVYDYLGLFRKKLPGPKDRTVFVEPKPTPSARPVLPEGRGVVLWRPKPGGGFSENHDLRLYRPGDDLRHIHWKMVAKTGKLMYREPMEPALRGYALNVTLCGTYDEVDRKLGQLLWSSRLLLDKGIDHKVRCMTGKGLVTFFIDDEGALERCIHRILQGPRASVDMIGQMENAMWQQEIGGDSNEA